MRQRGRGNHVSGAAHRAASSPHPTRPGLVGRVQELIRLTAALTRAQRGDGNAILLRGEPGIGKTRLAQELLDVARARGFQVLEGRAYAVEATLAYGPIVDAFGPVLRGLERPRLLALASDLPELGRIFGHLPLSKATPVGDDALEKTRLFEAVARLLERLAREAPVVLFIDDLHWADPSSVELLHYLARSAGGQRVLFLATYPSQGADAGRGLAGLLASLRRAVPVDEIVVPPLPPEATEALAHELLGGPPSAELVRLLNDRAVGTPLFVEGLLRALGDAGLLIRTEGGWTGGADVDAVVPAGVRDLMLERLGRLGVSERALADLLAVGGGVSHAVLHAASGLEEEPFLLALDRLRHLGLVVERLDGPEVIYSLNHPLLQEVAYTELPEMARRRAHVAIARVLEQRRRSDPDDLARHYRGAGPEVDPNRALEVLLSAGDRTRAVHAFDRAAHHYEAALRIVRDGRRPELLAMLLERLGEAWERGGEGGAAVALWTEALREYERDGDTRSMARLHRLLAAIEWERGHLESSRDHLAAGLSALAGQPPTQELADLLHARAVTLRRFGDAAGVESAVAELRAVARRLGSPRATGEASLAEVELHDSRGEALEARAKALRALAAAESAEDPLLEYRARDLLTIAAFRLGDHHGASADASRNRELAQRLGAPTLESRALVHGGLAAFLGGDWDGALRQSARAVMLARRVGRPRGVAQALIARAMIVIPRGDLAEAQACIQDARAAFVAHPPVDQHVASGVDLPDAMLALERGEMATARALADALAGSQAPGATVHLNLTILAEVQAATGEVQAAFTTARALAQLGGGEQAYSVALAARAEGLAYGAFGDATAARMCLERAVQSFTALGMPFEAARVRLEAATHSAEDAPDRERAAAAARESLSVFERLGARAYAHRARRVLRTLGSRPPAAPRPRPSGGPLSARELEVAGLVAERLTNTQIAERLVVSPRTVTTHLERIYSRLGIRSRGELARYVVEGELASPAHEIT